MKYEWKQAADDGEAMVIVLRYPLRRHLLVAIDATGSLSPKKASHKLQAPLHLVSYHMQVAKFYGTIYLSGSRPSRGSREHFYALTDLGERTLQVAEATHMIEPRDRHGDEEEKSS